MTTKKAIKTSNSMVRDGVSCKYLFHTWTMISCAEDRDDNELCDTGFAAAGVEGVAIIEPEGVRAAGGGFAAATGVGVLAAAK